MQLPHDSKDLKPEKMLYRAEPGVQDHRQRLLLWGRGEPGQKVSWM